MKKSFLVALSLFVVFEYRAFSCYCVFPCDSYVNAAWDSIINKLPGYYQDIGNAAKKLKEYVEDYSIPAQEKENELLEKAYKNYIKTLEPKFKVAKNYSDIETFRLYKNLMIEQSRNAVKNETISYVNMVSDKIRAELLKSLRDLRDSAAYQR